MPVSLARPDVSDLVFHVFERSVHPELFQTLEARRLRHPKYEAEIRLCQAGHVISLQAGTQVLVEVTASRQHPLPTHKRSLERRLNGCRHESRNFACGVQYQTSFQLERLEPEVFRRCHEELLDDSRSADLAYIFPAVHRFGPEPVSLLRVDATRDSLLVHAFHTFPDSSAVVKTQSLFEL